MVAFLCKGRRVGISEGCAYFSGLPSFEKGSSVASSGIIRQGGVRESVDWRAGREQGAAFRRFSGIIRQRDEKDAAEKELRTDLARPCGVAPGVLGLHAAFRRSIEGRFITPSGIIRQGGRKRRGGLGSGTENRWPCGV